METIYIFPRRKASHFAADLLSFFVAETINRKERNETPLQKPTG
jgi:hypothetical protein